ncbi:transcriptional regulator [Leifsonia sp. LS1]|uniref:helix-turn-helix transcriptional regulator n=1 Tax=Leifsonia sp. LS1 TaxID=2828483 RepID=UPI001CFE3092|nr:helix-turn-helix transcriptional regulator [Leifsonia sp. LS1]GIT81572.1 transcriptional regulator [Leifsonia sp. LS1]
MIDRRGLAEFIRHRREALQPEDVGLPPGRRRRAVGLRREEVAALSHMSTDYYSRLERGDGPQPSEQMLAAIAQGLHLTLAERDHLFRLGGRTPPDRGASTEHISPGMLRVFDRLDDTPAEIVTELGETLRQTALSVALVGDLVALTGAERSIGYRWFTDPGSRAAYTEEEREVLSRVYASGLRELAAARGAGSLADRLRQQLLDSSEEFRSAWDHHDVGLRPPDRKRFLHPEVGVLELSCQTLLDPEQSHRLLVYTATPGSDSSEKLRLLSVIGARSFA